MIYIFFYVITKSERSSSPEEVEFGACCEDIDTFPWPAHTSGPEVLTSNLTSNIRTEVTSAQDKNASPVTTESLEDEEGSKEKEKLDSHLRTFLQKENRCGI